MKTSELLERAEKFLWDGTGRHPRRGESAFLCIAVRFAAPGGPASRRARNGIAHRIFPCVTYADWAAANGHLPIDWREHRDYWRPIIQANRLRWLRELQREYREKGD